MGVSLRGILLGLVPVPADSASLPGPEASRGQNRLWSKSRQMAWASAAIQVATSWGTGCEQCRRPGGSGAGKREHCYKPALGLGLLLSSPVMSQPYEVDRLSHVTG